MVVEEGGGHLGLVLHGALRVPDQAELLVRRRPTVVKTHVFPILEQTHLEVEELVEVEEVEKEEEVEEVEEVEVQHLVRVCVLLPSYHDEALELHVPREGDVDQQLFVRIALHIIHLDQVK